MCALDSRGAGSLEVGSAGLGEKVGVRVLPGVVSCLAGIPAGAHSPGGAIGCWRVETVLFKLLTKLGPSFVRSPLARFGGPGFRGFGVLGRPS